MSEIEDQHKELVTALVKPATDILDNLTPHKCNVMHMAVGISGEAGELLDGVKRLVIYGKQLDIKNIIEELGDLEFYMEGLRQALGLTREECLKANHAKLTVRYSKMKYSDEDALHRADKK